MLNTVKKTNLNFLAPKEPPNSLRCTGQYGEAAKIPDPMEAAWITKNYEDDLYLEFTYVRVLDRRLAHASKNDKLRRYRPGREETTPPIQRRL
uniref:Uncharacterized protein n=1 Tax=Angiostrongylus cantonensis TaxID=6313 RepID=A0A0K0D3G8_ANGCA